MLWLRDSVLQKTFPKAPTGFVMEEVQHFDTRFDVFFDALIRQHPDTLIGERTSAVLSWHFGPALRRGRLWIFTATRNSVLCAYCICTRSDHQEVLVADYQTIEPDLDLLPSLLQLALLRCADEGAIILENYGRGVPKMRSLDTLAPASRKLRNWRFYYRAADHILNNELQNGRHWDPSVYDGDASIS
jgi:hypothetical protein